MSGSNLSPLAYPTLLCSECGAPMRPSDEPVGRIAGYQKVYFCDTCKTGCEVHLPLVNSQPVPYEAPDQPAAEETKAMTA